MYLCGKAVVVKQSIKEDAVHIQKGPNLYLTVPQRIVNGGLKLCIRSLVHTM